MLDHVQKSHTHTYSLHIAPPDAFLNIGLQSTVVLLVESIWLVGTYGKKHIPMCMCFKRRGGQTKCAQSKQINRD